MMNIAPEFLTSTLQRGRIRYALFDFDGTLSLIREGWQDTMSALMVEQLQKTPTHESRPELEAIVADLVSKSTGQQTIFQMIALCREIEKRGGTPADPLVYKHQYLDRLERHIHGRVAALKAKKIAAETLMVPGARQILETLRRQGVTCYLASGTDEPDVRDEAAALGLAPYFAGIFGARDDYRQFSKKLVIERIMLEHNLHGPEFVAFGDGFVEIEETKAVGGIAVGIASNEATRQGIDQWKRQRLIEAGADIIVPDFRSYKTLLVFLFDESPKVDPTPSQRKDR